MRKGGRNCTSPNYLLSLISFCVYPQMSLMVVKVASAATLYQQHQQQQSLNDIESSADEPSQATTEIEPSDSDSDIEKMRAKLQQLQHEQQQQYLRQQQQQLQLHLQQMQATQGAAGETAYLLERADSNIAPIYGTWRTKAQRQQHATSSHETDDAHVYERLPKRSATMTPLRGLLRDQMPRPRASPPRICNCPWAHPLRHRRPQRVCYEGSTPKRREPEHFEVRMSSSQSRSTSLRWSDARTVH